MNKPNNPLLPTYRCPQCGAEAFLVTAHVTQDWKIDSHNNFLECINDCVEVTHQPDEEDLWYCANCEYNGPGYAFRIDRQKGVTKCSLETST